MKNLQSEPISFTSSILNNFFWNLDDSITELENENKDLRIQNRELNQEVASNLHQKIEQDRKELSGILLAMLGGADKELTSIQVATVVRTIRDMESIEQVHQYCDRILDSLKESFNH